MTTIVPSYATPRFRPMSDLSWTPDGKWLAVGILSSPGEPPGIWLLEVDGTNRRRLTTAQPTSKTPNEEYGDVSPAFSADGRRMVFVRETGPGVNAIYVLPLSSDLTPAGDPVKVAGETRSGVLGVAWTPDDSGLVFASGGHLGIHPEAVSALLEVVELDRSLRRPPALDEAEAGIGEQRIVHGERDEQRRRVGGHRHLT